MRFDMFSGGMRFLVWPALALTTAAATCWCWQLPTRRLALEVLQVSNDQVRITWNGDSAAAMLASSGAMEIQDGANFRHLFLSGEQVRQGSLVYRREAANLRVRLRIDSGERWARIAPARDAALFQGTPVPAERPRLTGADRSPEPDTPPARAEELKPAPEPEVNSANRAMPRRAAVIPDLLPPSNAPADPLPIPPEPSLATLRPAVSAPAFALALPPGVVPTPKRPAYSGPRYGRIIWTGSMQRRGVVEIEGARSSIGSISGGLPGVAVTVKVSPAEFSPQGLLVHSMDASANNRRETASASNGWNATLFRWEPERARELVVLEAPNPSNEFKRLAVRNDARACKVMLVEWTVR